MGLFEFSPMDILLMAGIFILIVIYIALVIHLKPSLKSKKSHEEDLNFEIRQKNPERKTVENSSQPITPVKTKEILEEFPKTVKPREETKEEFQTPKEPVPTLPTKEAPKIKELLTNEAKKIPKKAGPPGCSYFFGYLGELPKNNPIPDECLGCLKIMECLIKRSTNST